MSLDCDFLNFGLSDSNFFCCALEALFEVVHDVVTASSSDFLLALADLCAIGTGFSSGDSGGSANGKGTEITLSDFSASPSSIVEIMKRSRNGFGLPMDMLFFTVIN